MKNNDFEFPFNFIKKTYELSEEQTEAYIKEYEDEEKDVFATFTYYYNRLPERMRKIVKLRHVDERSYRKIGKELGISGERAAQIERKAMSAMRRSVKFDTLFKGRLCVDKERDKELRQLRELLENYTTATSYPLYEKSIYDFVEFTNLSTRASFCLYSLGIQKIKDLTNISRDDILNYRNCGTKTADEIEKAALFIGILLKEGDRAK